MYGPVKIIHYFDVVYTFWDLIIKIAFRCEKNIIKKFIWTVQEKRENYFLNILLY